MEPPADANSGIQFCGQTIKIAYLTTGRTCLTVPSGETDSEVVEDVNDWARVSTSRARDLVSFLREIGGPSRWQSTGVRHRFRLDGNPHDSEREHHMDRMTSSDAGEDLYDHYYCAVGSTKAVTDVCMSCPRDGGGMGSKGHATRCYLGPILIGALSFPADFAW